ncbi:MAG: M48 family metallopeptidase [Burkholderiaceae bacterium]
MKVSRATALRYLAGYPEPLLAQVRTLLEQGRLRATLAQRHPGAHMVRGDRELRAYVGELKARHLRSTPPLSKVIYDNRLHVRHDALGTHTTVSRVQGTALTSKREIRVASVFRDAPEAFLRMIVVHELAHLRERTHDKAFYALCTRMEPDYFQLEFDTRVWLTALELEPKPAG